MTTQMTYQKPDMQFVKIKFYCQNLEDMEKSTSKDKKEMAIYYNVLTTKQQINNENMNVL